MTAYAHKDENNKFLVKKWNEEPALLYTEEWSNAEVELVKHGDLVRLEHVMTRRNIHSHQQPAPMSKKQFQITGYGENGTGDANDVWRVEIVGGKDGDIVQTVTTKVKFHHYFMKCVISCSGKQLPKWGYEQQEIACNPTTRDPNSQWNVEDNFYPRLPNVSFQNFAAGFVARFLESHQVMLQGNAGLKPKEGEYTSQCQFPKLCSWICGQVPRISSSHVTRKRGFETQRRRIHFPMPVSKTLLLDLWPGS